ncbi:MAG: hypothetical protein LBN43_06315, partial [Oscillospiraceae bacterium]|nr:hypothetical protein [Oscillospiraceae bacterium]
WIKEIYTNTIPAGLSAPEYIELLTKDSDNSDEGKDYDAQVIRAEKTQAAVDMGIDIEDYLNLRNELNGLTPEGEATAREKYDAQIAKTNAIAELDTLTKEQQAFMLEAAFGTSTRQDDFTAMLDSGMDVNSVGKWYAERSEINADTSLKAAQRAQKFAADVLSDKSLTPEQRDITIANLGKFGSAVTLTADIDEMNALKNIGISYDRQAEYTDLWQDNKDKSDKSQQMYFVQALAKDKTLKDEQRKALVTAMDKSANYTEILERYRRAIQSRSKRP